MNWKTMPKQKRDLLVLGSILAVGALVLLYMYVLTPWMNKRAARIQEYAQLVDNIKKAKSLRENLNSAHTKAWKDELHALGPDLAKMFPPEENTFLWANGWLDRAARSAGLSLDMVNEITSPPPDWVQSPSKTEKPPSTPPGKTAAPPVKKKRFGPYRVSCSVSGDFRDMAAMVEALQAENPYLSIVKMDIVGSTPDSLRQRAEVVIEWPRHSGPLDKKLAEFLLDKSSGGPKP